MTVTRKHDNNKVVLYCIIFIITGGTRIFIMGIHLNLVIVVSYLYSGTLIIRTPIIQMFDYLNAKLTAQLEYFVN